MYRVRHVSSDVSIARPRQPHFQVVPTLSGRGWITGFASYVIADDDPFPEGFTVADIW